MPSDADDFEEIFDRLKEFVDDEGHHFYVIQFEDDSGRVFRKKQSEDGISIAEFDIRSRQARDVMRSIASATDFEFDDGKNTQQNLRNLMDRS